MRKSLLVSPTGNMSREDWHRFRIRGLGGSEVGTVLGLNQYKASIELWYEKLMLQPHYDMPSIKKFMGHFHEDPLAELWQYWDPKIGTVDAMMRNYLAGNIIRKCQRVNAYVQNPDYPNLFVSLDRKINKGERGEEGALEIKTIAGHEADKWEAGIPPAHLVQVITQMLVCDFKFGEIIAQRDGNQIDVWPFEFNPVIAKQIIERTTKFWDSVKKGRVILTQKFEAVGNHNMKRANELQAELESLEPEPDGSEAYEKFLKTKFRKSMAEVGLVPGNALDLHNAQELARIKEKMKQLDTEARECENKLKRRIGNGETLDFGADGRVTWRGNPRRFSLSLK